jgi:hypothetical protein
MAEKKKDTKTNLDTKVYSISVNLTVQILAENEKDALERLDSNGGYVTKREVEVINSIPLNSTKTLSAVE